MKKYRKESTLKAQRNFLFHFFNSLLEISKVSLSVKSVSKIKPE